MNHTNNAMPSSIRHKAWLVSIIFLLDYWESGKKIDNFFNRYHHFLPTHQSANDSKHRCAIKINIKNKKKKKKLR